MFDFKKKKKIKNILYSKPTIILLGLVFIFLVNSTWGIYEKSEVASNNKNIALNNLNELNERESDLLSKIEKLKTERGVEEEVRDKFGVVKKGEEIVIIVEPEIEDEENGWKNIINPINLWQKFLGIFK